MREVFSILEEIKNTGSTNGKIVILRQQRSNKLLRDTLRVCFDPSISTNLALKKMEKEVGTAIYTEIDSFDKFLDFVSKKSTGKDTDILSVQVFMREFDDFEQGYLKAIATKTLTIGMDVKNINKAFDGRFIDVVEPMLALNVDKVVDKLTEEDVFFFSKKLDGNRVLIRIDADGSKRAYSRNGLVLEGYSKFLAELDLPHGNFYDGELLANIEGDSKAQYKRTSEITRTKGEKPKEEIRFHIFDIIPVNEFLDGSSELEYSQRRVLLDNLPTNKYQTPVKCLAVSPVNKDVFKLLDKLVAEGEEGLMANSYHGKYECGKRSKNILKFKKFNTVDLKCLGVLEGEGAFKGMLGAIQVDYKGNVVKVGSGFTQEQRKFYWSNQDEIINRVVEVQYFEETKNKDGGVSLRFPVFLEVREKGKEVSYE